MKLVSKQIAKYGQTSPVRSRLVASFGYLRHFAFDSRIKMLLPLPDRSKATNGG